MSTTPRITQVVLTWILGVVAGLGALTSAILIDIDIDRDLPDPPITAAIVFTAATAIVAVQLGVNYVAQARLVTGQDRVIQAVKAGVQTITQDTGGIPRITDTIAGMQDLTDVVAYVGQLAGELQVVSERQKWLLVDRGLLPPVQPPEQEKKLSRSEYWEIYKDVMADLGDVGEDPPSD